jgi:retinol dehydrogenase-12
MTQKKVAIVTGGNTGLGKETALALAKVDIKVFITCRSVDKGREAVTYIQDACPTADVEILLLDLKTLESVRKCAAEFKSRKLPLNILVNNAGAAMGKPWYTQEGVGGSAQVNHLGAYTLTRLLEEELTLGAPSRVVNVSSVTHRLASMPDAVSNTCTRIEQILQELLLFSCTLLFWA